MRKISFSLLALLLCLSVGAAAQNSTATLTGIVTDSSGAVIPNAKVTLHDVATNVDTRTVMSDASGSYTASQVPNGTYSVTVEAPNFQKSVISNVILHVGDQRTLNAALQPGTVEQVVNVAATSVPVETSSAAQEQTITGKQIRELELNNRNFEQLVTLQPGVSSGLPDQVGLGLSNTTSISVNGNRTTANNWTVDGADVNDSGSNSTLINVPSVDALEEFKIGRSTYDAQYGRSGGGQINVVTRSGTNQIHASAYEFLRNDKLNANDFLLNARPQPNGQKAPRSPLRYNNFGYTAGGPLIKNKTFVFFSEEWRRQTSPVTLNATLPNPQILTGNFSGLYSGGRNSVPVVLDPTGAPAGCVANNTISANCFSQNAKAYLSNIYSKFSPASSLCVDAAGHPTINCPQFITAASATSNTRQELVRLDQNVSSRVQLFGRYEQDNVPTTEPGGLFAGVQFPGIAATATNAPGRTVVAHGTMQLSPTLLNEAAFNYSWGAINSNLTGAFGQRSSFNGLVTNTFPYSDPYNRIPGVSISNISGIFAPAAPYHERNIDKDFYDNLSWVHGNHTLRSGLDLQYLRKSENGPTGVNGSFGFSDAGAPTAANGYIPGFGNFLLGQASSFSQSSRDIIPNLHYLDSEFYVQDDWKVKPRLMLNLGLRYSLFPAPHDTAGTLDAFDPAVFNPANAPAINPKTGNFVPGGATPATYLNGIIVAGQNSPYANRVNPNYKKDFAPRLGFVYDLNGDGKSVLRGGYGIYFDRTLNGIFEQNEFQNPPFVSSISLTNPNNTDLFDNPQGGSQVVSLAPRFLRTTGTPGFQTPYAQNWNLSYQREILPNTLFEAAYVGNKGTHLLGLVNLNQVHPEVRAANPTANVNALRPYQGYAGIGTITPAFDSNYHSLQLSVNRSVGQGLTLGAAYTWSKALTDNATDRSTSEENAYNLRIEKGRAGFNQSQILVINYVYDLPFLKDTHNLVGTTFGGWEGSGITTFNTGFPLTVLQNNEPFFATKFGTSSEGLGTTRNRADITGPLTSGPKTAQAWFNTSLFADAIGHFGTSANGIITGPGRSNFDFALLKNFRFTERINSQLRGEFFNIFNHTQFNGVNTNVDSGGFGQVFSVHSPRIVQLGLKLNF